MLQVLQAYRQSQGIMDISTLLGQGGVWSQISVPFWGIWADGSVWSAGSHPPQSRRGYRVWELKGGRLLGHRLFKDIGHRISMDTKITEKLQIAQTIIDILNDGTRKDKVFVESCVEQLMGIRRHLILDLAKCMGETHLDTYTHIANMIDHCNHTISQHT